MVSRIVVFKIKYYFAISLVCHKKLIISYYVKHILKDTVINQFKNYPLQKMFIVIGKTHKVKSNKFKNIKYSKINICFLSKLGINLSILG